MPLPTAIAEHFLWQATVCDNLGSPFTALLCRLIAGRLDPGGSRFGARIAAWTGNARAEALSLRAAGGLHALARAGVMPQLTTAYPPHPADAEKLWAAVEQTIAQQDAFLHDYLDSPPQTNEVARSSVVLGGCLMIARQTGLKLEVYELGSSAGLNLGFDNYRYDFGVGRWGSDGSPVEIASRWEGNPPPLDQAVSVTARAGCDVRPLDPGSAADRDRLLSYIWADQTVRLARTEAALGLAAAAPWRVARADAAAWVTEGLKRPPAPGVVRVIFHTIVWSYLPAATRSSIEQALVEAGAAATAASPLARLEMEMDEIHDSAALRLTTWPGGGTRDIGRADFHGRWVRWNA